MRVLDPQESAELLQELRAAAFFQIELWESANRLSVAADDEVDRILQDVEDLALCADTGLELQTDNLHEILGMVEWRTRSSKSTRHLAYSVLSISGLLSAEVESVLIQLRKNVEECGGKLDIVVQRPASTSP